jgi:protein dithiol oxidoreductase (disulfide-forming)
MTVDRRDFLVSAGAVALLGTTTGTAIAQQPAAPAEGREFRSVKPPQPTEAPDGKVEVVEFFWYGCPHCNSLEPILKEWVGRLPDHVVFRKVHVPFGLAAHQQLFYTLQALGKAEALNERVFAAIHEQRQRLDKPEDMADFVARHGIDRKQFLDTYGSFGVRTRMQRATQLAAGYKIDGVPSFGVNGKYVTAPSMVGSNAAALRMIELLVERERKGA